MWPINHPPEPVCDWLNFEPERVLYEYDGPMIFTLKSEADGLFLAFQADRDRDAIRFLVVPFSDALEHRLVTGDINLRDALTRPKMWVFDLNKKWEPVRCWRVSDKDLPAGLLPKPGVMLWTHLRPIMKRLTVRPGGNETVLTKTFPGNLVHAG